MRDTIAEQCVIMQYKKAGISKSDGESLVISLSCPSIVSLSWCLKLYSLGEHSK